MPDGGVLPTFWAITDLVNLLAELIAFRHYWPLVNLPHAPLVPKTEAKIIYFFDSPSFIWLEMFY